MTLAAASRNQGLSHWPADASLPLLTEPLGDLLRRNAEHFPDRPALLIPQGEDIAAITHAQLLAKAENVARWLAARYAPGDRIALWSRNAFESVVLQHACALAGTIIAPFNPGWSDGEASHALSLTNPALLFAGMGNRDDDLLPRAAELTVKQDGGPEILMRFIIAPDWPVAEAMPG